MYWFVYSSNFKETSNQQGTDSINREGGTVPWHLVASVFLPGHFLCIRSCAILHLRSVPLCSSELAKILTSFDTLISDETLP